MYSCQILADWEISISMIVTGKINHERIIWMCGGVWTKVFSSRGEMSEKRFPSKTRKRVDDPVSENEWGSYPCRDKIHECGACSKRFLRKCARDLHYNTIHLGIKNFECHICKKKYAQRANLEYHLRTHGEVIYECILCQERLENLKCLKTHTENHVRESKEEDSQVASSSVSLED